VARRWLRKIARRPACFEARDGEAKVPPTGLCSLPLLTLPPRGDNDNVEEDEPVLTCGSSAEEAAPFEVAVVILA
jgi:hypothetical protein